MSAFEVPVDRDAAVAIAESEAFPADWRPGSPVAVLRMVTARKGDGTSGSKPGWVVIWQGSAPDIHGPITLSNAEREALASRLRCVFVMSVDAASGSVDVAEQICEKR